MVHTAALMVKSQFSPPAAVHVRGKCVSFMYSCLATRPWCHVVSLWHFFFNSDGHPQIAWQSTRGPQLMSWPVLGWNVWICVWHTASLAHVSSAIIVIIITITILISRNRGASFVWLFFPILEGPCGRALETQLLIPNYPTILTNWGNTVLCELCSAVSTKHLDLCLAHSGGLRFLPSPPPSIDVR